jgi:regulator of RNase E activity RraA
MRVGCLVSRSDSYIVPHKVGPAYTGDSIVLGGTIIQNRDLVIADADGVVIWSQERISELMIKEGPGSSKIICN